MSCAVHGQLLVAAIRWRVMSPQVKTSVFQRGACSWRACGMLPPEQPPLLGLGQHSLFLAPGQQSGAHAADHSIVAVVAQTYYKLPFVDHSIAHPEVPICEDVPKLARGLAELLGEWLGAAADGLFYSVQLQVWPLRATSQQIAGHKASERVCQVQERVLV